MKSDDNNTPRPDPPQNPVPWEIIESQPTLEYSSAAVTGLAQDPGPQGVQGPEDLRVPWGWTDLFLLVIVYVAGSMVLSIPVLIVFLLSGVSQTELINSQRVQGLFIICNQALLSLATLAYLGQRIRHHFQAPFWRTIGWRALEPGRVSRGRAYMGIFAGGLLFSLLIQFLSTTLGTKAKLPIEALFQDQQNAILLMLMAVTIAPAFEETVFRGYIYPVIARSFGVATSVVVTGTLFGMLHALQLWGGWVQIGLMIIVGIVFTYVRSVTRTVVASYLLHLSYNSVPFLAYVIASHGFRQLPLGP